MTNGMKIIRSPFAASIKQKIMQHINDNDTSKIYKFQIRRKIIYKRGGETPLEEWLDTYIKNISWTYNIYADSDDTCLLIIKEV